MNTHLINIIFRILSYTNDVEIKRLIRASVSLFLDAFICQGCDMGRLIPDIRIDMKESVMLCAAISGYDGNMLFKNYRTVNVKDEIWPVNSCARLIWIKIVAL
jgi:hypothetical protein